jgi:flagellar hook protein FlgE
VSPIPTIGAEITQIQLNFGTAGVLGTGERNGLTGDAEGTYQTINGVNTYVPDSHATVTQNGFADGTLTGIAFDQTGTIQGTFSNGQTIALAQVAMATVENEGGLTNVGNNYYQQSVNSGAETIGLAGSNGAGTIIGGALEGSNVDLTVELSNMIIAQRGFEVNARVITVESQNLQTLTQLGQ